MQYACFSKKKHYFCILGNFIYKDTTKKWNTEE